MISATLASLLLVMKWKKEVFLANRNYLDMDSSNREYHSALSVLVETLVEFVLFPTYLSIDIDGKSIELLKKAEKDGALLLAMHFGNFEQMCSTFVRYAPSFRGAYKPLKSNWANSILMKLRSRGICYVDAKLNNPRAVDQFLSRNGFFGLMVDQDCRKKTAPKFSFLGKQIKVNPWILHLLKGRKECLVPILSKKSMGMWALEVIQVHYGDEREALELIHQIYAGHMQKEHINWHGWWHKRFKSVVPDIYPS